MGDISVFHVGVIFAGFLFVVSALAHHVRQFEGFSPLHQSATTRIYFSNMKAFLSLLLIAVVIATASAFGVHTPLNGAKNVSDLNLLMGFNLLLVSY
jgi:hypothetical protein